MGESSHLDFRRLCSVVASMRNGVWFNMGSAVIMPEVFLKAVSVVRNFGHDISGLIAINLDKKPSTEAWSMCCSGRLPRVSS